jgi:hypothetical protein
MLSAFTRGTVHLPNDDVLPTADASTERFEQNLLSNGALLPDSAHMPISSLYQFLVLTTPWYGWGSVGVLLECDCVDYLLDCDLWLRVLGGGS